MVLRPRRPPRPTLSLSLCAQPTVHQARRVWTVPPWRAERRLQGHWLGRHREHAVGVLSAPYGWQLVRVGPLFYSSWLAFLSMAITAMATTLRGVDHTTRHMTCLPNKLSPATAWLRMFVFFCFPCGGVVLGLFFFFFFFLNILLVVP